MLKATLPSETLHQKRTSARKIYILFLLVIGSVLVLLLSGITIRYLRPEKTPFSSDQTKAIKQLSFAVYYPKHLPQGYTINLQMLSISDSVVSYVIEGGQDTRIYFSFQPLPDRAIIDNLFAGNPDRSTIVTPLGEATTAFVSNRQIASIVVKNTWLIISTVNPVEKPTLLAILEHMRRL